MSITRTAFLEAFSRAQHDSQTLVNDLLALLDSRDKRIEELESQVEELENDKLTLLSRGLDLDDVVEG